MLMTILFYTLEWSNIFYLRHLKQLCYLYNNSSINKIKQQQSLIEHDSIPYSCPLSVPHLPTFELHLNNMIEYFMNISLLNKFMRVFIQMPQQYGILLSVASLDLSR